MSGVLCASVYLIMNKRSDNNSTAQYTVGILQTASHPALDAVVQGFQAELQQLAGDEQIVFVVQNAQGSVSSAHTIAQQFHSSSKYDLFFTIATPAAQAMHAVEKERPIVIAAVTDPVALDLVYPGSNVSGVTDMINVQASIDLLQQLVPHAKNIGILYTTGETNSRALVEIMKLKLVQAGLTPRDFAVGGESDIQAVTELACRKSDLIMAPTDNTVASTISLITMITRNYKKPLIVCDNMLVAAGALAAQGVDYKKSGQQAAHCAFDLLTGNKKISDLPIEQTVCQEIFVHEIVMQELGISIPEKLDGSIIFV